MEVEGGAGEEEKRQPAGDAAAATAAAAAAAADDDDDDVRENMRSRCLVVHKQFELSRTQRLEQEAAAAAMDHARARDPLCLQPPMC